MFAGGRGARAAGRGGGRRRHGAAAVAEIGRARRAAAAVAVARVRRPQRLVHGAQPRRRLRGRRRRRLRLRQRGVDDEGRAAQIDLDGGYRAARAAPPPTTQTPTAAAPAAAAPQRLPAAAVAAAAAGRRRRRRGQIERHARAVRKGQRLPRGDHDPAVAQLGAGEAGGGRRERALRERADGEHLAALHARLDLGEPCLLELGLDEPRQRCDRARLRSEREDVARAQREARAARDRAAAGALGTRDGREARGERDRAPARHLQRAAAVGVAAGGLDADVDVAHAPELSRDEVAQLGGGRRLRAKEDGHALAERDDRSAREDLAGRIRLGQRAEGRHQRHVRAAGRVDEGRVGVHRRGGLPEPRCAEGLLDHRRQLRERRRRPVGGGGGDGDDRAEGVEDEVRPRPDGGGRLVNGRLEGRVAGRAATPAAEARADAARLREAADEEVVAEDPHVEVGVAGLAQAARDDPREIGDRDRGGADGDGDPRASVTLVGAADGRGGRGGLEAPRPAEPARRPRCCDGGARAMGERAAGAPATVPAAVAGGEPPGATAAEAADGTVASMRTAPGATGASRAAARTSAASAASSGHAGVAERGGVGGTRGCGGADGVFGGASVGGASAAARFGVAARGVRPCVASPSLCSVGPRSVVGRGLATRGRPAATIVAAVTLGMGSGARAGMRGGGLTGFGFGLGGGGGGGGGGGAAALSTTALISAGAGSVGAMSASPRSGDASRDL